MPDTPQQIAFVATATDKTSIALKARAGTGKTYSLQKWANATSGTGFATSFSRPTALELGKKMPRRFTTSTIHSACLTAIRNSGKYKKLPDRDPLSPKSKVYTITKEVMEELETPWDLQSPIMKLVSSAKTYGLIHRTFQREGLMLDEPESWESLAELFDIQFTEEIYLVARKVLEVSTTMALKEGILDFDDMLYISVLWPHRFARYPKIIVDEAQDLSSIQVNALTRMLMPGGRLVAAGDDRQAIYGFRGALTDSYSVLVDGFKMSEMPLTVSFRCPKAVITEAQKWVPDIESAPGSIDGEVIWHDNLSTLEVPNTVLCRNNAPLVRLALKLLVSGRTAEVAGRDIGKGLISLTKRITKKNLSTSEFLVRLKKWADREIERKPHTKPRVVDKQKALEALSEHHPDLRAVQQHLEKLYPDPRSINYRPAEVHLSTIHKAKGREWKDVLVLDPQLMPSKYASQEWEIKQEHNLAYVAVTRAQKTLHYAVSDEIWSK